jgi:hypothetical protein
MKPAVEAAGERFTQPFGAWIAADPLPGQVSGFS